MHRFGELPAPRHAPRARALPRDPARLPPRVEVLALVIALAAIAAFNLLRDGATDAVAAGSPASPSAAEPATPPTTEPPPPLGAPPPAGPVTLESSGALPVVHRVPTEDRVVFVTIDDGLEPDPAVLELLVEREIPHTSFLTLPFVREDVGFWEESVRAGGMIEGHTIDHQDLTAVSDEQRHREVCGTQEPLTELFGRTPTLFRPPYGTFDERTLATAASCGYHALVMWSGTANHGVIELQAGTLQPGDIILMHWREDLLANLESLTYLLEAEGFRVGLLEDYLPPGR